MRETRFKNETVKECTECGGTGKVMTQEGRSEVCPVCEGTGMVKRTAEGTVRYEPYKPTEEPAAKPQGTGASER